MGAIQIKTCACKLIYTYFLIFFKKYVIWGVHHKIWGISLGILANFSSEKGTVSFDFILPVSQQITVNGKYTRTHKRIIKRTVVKGKAAVDP